MTDHQLMLGDRVSVLGKPHMPGHKAGVIRQIEGDALGIQFDGTAEIHHCYVSAEVAREQPGAEKDDEHEMAASQRPAARATRRGFEIKSSDTPELFIYDEIGPGWMGFIDAKRIISALASVKGKPLTVRINSPGGDVFEAVAIYNALARHDSPVTVEIDGLAASAASYIAMAGKKIRIAENAMVMIHNPWMFAMGSADDLMHSAELLAKLEGTLADAYAERSDLDPKEVRKMMDAETWLTAAEAVEKGLADEIGQPLQVKASLPDPRLFKFKRLPERFRVDSALPNRPITKEDDHMSVAASAVTAPAQTAAAPAAPAAAQATAQAATPAAPAVAAAPAVDVKAVADEARAAEKKRQQQITALCETAGLPAKAREFIEKDTSVEDVRTALFDAICASRTAIGDAGGSGPAAKADENKAYREEYAKQKDAYAKVGVSEEEYVKSRRIDDGKDVLAPQPKKAA